MKNTKFRRDAIPDREPTTEKALLCLVEVRAKGQGCWDERSDRELIALRRRKQSSRRYTGAMPSKIPTIPHKLSIVTQTEASLN